MGSLPGEGKEIAFVFCFRLWNNQTTMAAANTTTIATGMTIFRITERLCFAEFDCMIGHACRCNPSGPPQSPWFPLIHKAVAFLKIHFVGTSPVRWLDDKSSFSRNIRSLRATGIDPVKLLWDRLRICRLLILPSKAGMLPLKKLSPSSITSKLSQLPNVLGISSDRLFDEICKYVSCLAFPMSAWSDACRLLKDKLMLINVGIVKISFGIVPWRLLEEMSNASSTLRFPRLEGIGPFNWFDSRASHINWDIFENDDGMSP